MFECLLQCLLPRPKWGLVFGDRILYYSARLILACCGISCMGQQGKLNALLADVESSALITLPNHFNLLLWIVVLHSITLVLLYTSSFLTVFGHFTFSTYVLSSLRWNVSRFFSAWEDVIVQISQFYRKISSIQALKTVIFVSGVSFLLSKIACILFAAFIARTLGLSLFYIFVCINHATHIFTLSLLMGSPRIFRFYLR